MNVRYWIYGVLVLLLVVATLARFQDYVVEEDFLVYAHIPCQQGVTCFVTLCDDESVGCTQEAYSKAQILASRAPSCIYENDCGTYACTQDADCKIISCLGENLEEGEECSVSNEL